MTDHMADSINTKIMTLIMNKNLVANYNFRAVSHPCDVLFVILSSFIFVFFECKGWAAPGGEMVYAILHNLKNTNVNVNIYEYIIYYILYKCYFQ